MDKEQRARLFASQFGRIEVTYSDTSAPHLTNAQAARVELERLMPDPLTTSK